VEFWKLSEESHATRPKINELVEQAQDEDSNQRIQAISALGDRELTDEVVHATLRAALEDDDASVRSQAFQSLVMRGGDEAIEYVSRALSDSDPNVRIVAVEYVEPNNHGISILQEALGDSDETVRSLAASRFSEVSGQPEIGE
jgi:HEAT repeat protein